jgi:hypothetical protein
MGILLAMHEIARGWACFSLAAARIALPATVPVSQLHLLRQLREEEKESGISVQRICDEIVTLSSRSL